MFRLHRTRLETLAIITAFLYMTYRCTEQCRAVLLCNSKQGNLVIKWDELLHYHLHDIATAPTAGILPGLIQFAGCIHLALAVTAAAHKRLNDTGETDLCGSLL